MDTDKQVRLADFGFAKILEEGQDTMTGLCGTKVTHLYSSVLSSVLVIRRAHVRV